MPFSDYMDLIAQDIDTWIPYLIGFISGLLVGMIPVLANCLFDFIERLIYVIRNRGFKRSSKLTIEQRLDLLEDNFVSLADIVISSSPEEQI